MTNTQALNRAIGYTLTAMKRANDMQKREGLRHALTHMHRARSARTHAAREQHLFAARHYLQTVTSVA